jgi:hypothetical protein
LMTPIAISIPHTPPHGGDMGWGGGDGYCDRGRQCYAILQMLWHRQHACTLGGLEYWGKLYCSQRNQTIKKKHILRAWTWALSRVGVRSGGWGHWAGGGFVLSKMF